MDKYAQMNRFNYDHRLKFYMYAFMYVYPDTIAEREYFAATKQCCKLKNKMNSGISPKKLAWI